MAVLAQDLYTNASAWSEAYSVRDALRPDMQLSISFSSLVAASLLVLPRVCGLVVPSPTTLDSDITLLYNNDLNGEYSLHESGLC